ncbi:MAG: hypothetical protein ISR96_09700 [Nitrospira sp.]|nr:hypothetical protein [bacterium]MBL7049774.1 hypothetical protein [Nitrospira sp.]
MVLSFHIRHRRFAVRMKHLPDLKCSSGVTLLELLLSLTILTMITMIIGQGIHIGMNSWKKGDHETVESQRLRILSGRLSQQLKSAYPYTIKEDNADIVLFEGEKNSIMFVTAMTDLPFGGFKWVRYSYKDETLFYGEGILPDKKFLDETSNNELDIMDTAIGEIVFEYYNAEDEEWKEAWETGSGVPGAVRVRISYFEPFQIRLPLAAELEEDTQV